MSKSRWNRNERGLPLSRVIPAAYDREGREREGWFFLDGSANPLAFEAPVWHVNTVAWFTSGLEEGRAPNAGRVRKRMLDDPRCAGEPIFDDKGRLIAWSAQATSLQAWGRWDRAISDERMSDGTKQPKRSYRLLGKRKDSE